jgi:Na+/melibiose symporter-like transporter
MMMNNNILITCIAAPLFIVIRENPPKPPSKVATEKPKEKDFFKAVIIALKDKNFLILLLVFIFVNGAFVAIGTDCFFLRLDFENN